MSLWRSPRRLSFFLLWPSAHVSLSSCFPAPWGVRGAAGENAKAEEQKGAFMKRKKFFISLVADALFVAGLVAIVVGIALAGHLPAAVCVAGGESVGLGLLLSTGNRDGGENG